MAKIESVPVQYIMPLFKLAVDMRNKQISYYQTKTQSALIAAKQAERAFDKLLEEAKLAGDKPKAKKRTK